MANLVFLFHCNFCNFYVFPLHTNNRRRTCFEMNFVEPIQQLGCLHNNIFLLFFTICEQIAKF